MGLGSLEAVLVDVPCKHALRIYASGDNAAAKALSDKLKGGALQSGFTPRDLERKRWHGLTEKEDVHAALEFLIDAG